MTRARRIGRAAVVLATAGVVAGCSVFGGQAAEEPPFELIERQGMNEIRLYPAIAVAATTVAMADRDAAVGEGFGRLFGYISGGNRAPGTGESAEIAMTAPVLVDDAADGQEIAMTAPVLVAPGGDEDPGEGAEIAMTAPVLVDPAGDAAGWTVVFVLPEGMTAETAPVPTDPDVRIQTMVPRRVAVRRFSGFFSEGNAEEAEQALADWLSSKGLAHRGDWQSAGYNPPWTLPWLRRNEVIVTLTE
ncbi:MAG: heme-binding protein [Pseudomonadota bacterium]